MDLIQPSGEQPSLNEVRAQFEHWRHSRDKRNAIPGALWEAAASLYPAYSMHHISKTLRLNHTKLKQHIKGNSSDLTMPTEATFIEMGFAKPSPPCQCIVEMQHRNGGKMAMKVTGGSLDLMKLARLFWSRT